MRTRPDQLRRIARDQLRSADVEGVVRLKGRVGEPIPVEHPKGSVTHHFVPVAIGGKLAGYFLFDAELGSHQYSSFLRGSDDVEGAPDLSSWTRPERVRETAAAATKGQDLGEAYLTYDGVPSRLTWAVPVRSKGGPMVLFVAGEHVYAKPLDAESTG